MMVAFYHETHGGFGGGPLMEAGGVLDQLALYAHAFGVIGAEEARYRDEPGGGDA